MAYRTSAQWEAILDYAASMAEASVVTLRQLHYLCVSNPDLDYRNTESDYKQLSARTADLRRDGDFPTIADLTRSITTWQSWASPRKFMESIGDDYSRDYSEGQETLPVLLYEKATLTGVMDPIAMRYMIPHAALRGYSSETLDRQIQEVVDSEDRPVRIIYIGDFDADGEDIERNAQEWIDTDEWTRVAVNVEQIDQHGLAPNPGKKLSARRRAFLEKYGADIQVEVEALSPDVLRGLVQDAILDGWDTELSDQIRDEERDERQRLEDFISEWSE